MKKQIVLGLIATTMMASSAFAVKEGGGGGAFICQDPTQSEFLDLYEGRQAGLNIPESPQPIEEQIQNALAKLKSADKQFKNIFKVYAAVRAAQVIPLPKGEELAWPSDELNKYAKAGCPGKGIMLFHDKQNKHDVDSVDQDTASLNSLPNTEQAAAWVHETVYKYLRQNNSDSDSTRAQVIVGRLFSDENTDQIKALLKTTLPVGACLISTRSNPVISNCGIMEQGQCEHMNNDFFDTVFMGGPCGP